MMALWESFFKKTVKCSQENFYGRVNPLSELIDSNPTKWNPFRYPTFPENPAVILLPRSEVLLIDKKNFVFSDEYLFISSL
jgi:hypothetical protein